VNETMKGYVYRLKPTKKQINLINQTFGCVRKMWSLLLLERKSIYDTSFGTFTRYLEYKARDEGKTLIKIDQYYPSTKTCSQCGKEQDIKLFERTYSCVCGQKMDRDLNAAINIGVQGLIAYVTKAYGTDAIAW
jgi:transposase